MCIRDRPHKAAPKARRIEPVTVVLAEDAEGRFLLQQRPDGYKRQILPRLEKGTQKRVLFIATGALMSQTTFLQKESIPAVSYTHLDVYKRQELSSAMSSQINLPFITADATGPKHLDMTLTRAKFNELTADPVSYTHLGSKLREWLKKREN